MKKIEIKKSKINRKGLFATENIKKGEKVGVFAGKIIPDTKHNLKKYGDRLVAVSYKKAILLKNAFKYINHSCNPTCGVKDGIEIIALKNIKKGDEITIDYDTFEHNFRMKCNCLSFNCRKEIKGYKYLTIKLKEKYKNYTAPYLLKN